jgi:hypothetical protein
MAIDLEDGYVLRVNREAEAVRPSVPHLSSDDVSPLDG